MRVALFFDGNNFYRSMDTYDSTIELDYDRLARWVVREVSDGQGELAGAYYYTGFSDQAGLDRFLRGLEMRTGFFVRREPIVERTMSCPHCHGEVPYRMEKRVDTRLVAEMIQLAAVGAFERAVVFSGDEDLVPAVDAVLSLGKQVYVASWGGRALSHALRVHCFGHVDLTDGLDAFTTGRRRLSSVHEEAGEADADAIDDVNAGVEELMSQLWQAWRYFSGRDGQVSRWYFENRWKPDGPCPPAGNPRAEALQTLIDQGRVLVFEAIVNGRLVSAIRPAGAEPTPTVTTEDEPTLTV
ncbi:MAG: NYN domain-containing protein [Myxococcota bacterium]